jgi:hypothetical protein
MKPKVTIELLAFLLAFDFCSLLGDGVSAWSFFVTPSKCNDGHKRDYNLNFIPSNSLAP